MTHDDILDHAIASKLFDNFKQQVVLFREDAKYTGAYVVVQTIGSDEVRSADLSLEEYAIISLIGAKNDIKNITEIASKYVDYVRDNFIYEDFSIFTMGLPQGAQMNDGRLMYQINVRITRG